MKTLTQLVHLPPSHDLAQYLKPLKVWLFSAGILLLVSVFDPAQTLPSIKFTLQALWNTFPFLLLSIAIAAYAKASGTDSLIAKAFKGSPLTMIFFAALLGGISPFCSCGVIPIIAALLTMGVPLSAVMAFWLASPIMDPSMFVLTTGVISLEFALAKTLAAVGLGILGGLITYLLAGTSLLSQPLRPEVGNGGCGASSIRSPKAVHWAFWHEPQRRTVFAKEALKNTLFLLKWLTLAFVLESLMLVYLPAEWVFSLLGGDGLMPIVIATFAGVPAYLNGYAALPLVSGLIEQGMSASAGMTFLVAGGVTSLPAAIAVFALVKKPVFALYLAISLMGAMLTGLLFHLWISLMS